MQTGGVEINEHTRVKKALQESQRRLELALRLSNTGLWDWDLRTNQVYFSPEWKSQLGYAPHEIEGRYEEWESRLHPEDRDRTLAVLQNCLASPAGEYKMEFRLRHKDGSYRWILATGLVLKDPDGKPCRMMGYHRDMTEQKRLEDTIRSTKERLEAILETEPECVKLLSCDGRILQMNAAGLDMIEVESLEDVAGPPAVEFVVAEHRDSFRALCTRVCRGAKDKLEFKIIGRKGTVRWVETHAVPFSTESGDPAILAVTRDITARKQAEEALRQSEERHRSLLARIPDVTWTSNSEGKTTFVSPNVEQVYGFTAEEICAQGEELWLGRIHPDDAETVKRALARLFQNGEKFDVEYRVQRKDGTWIWVRDRATATYERDGMRWADGILTDITEKKRAAEETRRRDAIYRQIVESSSDGICLIAPDGTLSFVNDRPLEMLGYRREEAIGRSVFDFVEPEDVPKAQQHFLNCQQGAREQFDVRLRCKGGATRLVIVNSAPLLDQEGNFLQALVMLSDITERKQLEEQFLQAQKMEAVGRLAGGIAHDLNNILGVILGYSELVLEPLEPANPLRKKVEKIKDAADRAASLTRQLLAFSRKQVLEPRVLDLNAVIPETAKMLQRLIGEDVELILSLSSELGRVKADPAQVDQILMNLAVNARDAMPQGGRLIVETANVEVDEAYSRRRPLISPGSYVRLAVSDTGVGMSKEIQERIFEPFFTTKEKGKGTGLGLSTVYGIVKQSGGFIWVYSEPGNGTTFKIYLPRVDVPAEAEGQGVPRFCPNGSETVLLVEDDPLLREVSRSLLEELGYHVLEAGNGAEAIRLAQQQQPIHLLMTDVVMPGMNGRELAEKLRLLRPELKVLFVSGYTDDVIRQRDLLEAGTAFIQKPFTKAPLAGKLRELLAESRPRYRGRG